MLGQGLTLGKPFGLRKAKIRRDEAKSLWSLWSSQFKVCLLTVEQLKLRKHRYLGWVEETAEIRKAKNSQVYSGTT